MPLRAAMHYEVVPRAITHQLPRALTLFGREGDFHISNYPFTQSPHLQQWITPLER